MSDVRVKALSTFGYKGVYYSKDEEVDVEWNIAQILEVRKKAIIVHGKGYETTVVPATMDRMMQAEDRIFKPLEEKHPNAFAPENNGKAKRPRGRPRKNSKGQS